RPEDGILRLTLRAPGRLNAVSEAQHGELARVWQAIGQDEETRAVLVRGADGAFSSGGDLDLVLAIADDADTRLRVFHEARDLVSLCVPEEELEERALEVAQRLAAGSRAAISHTKLALNEWMLRAGPIFDASLELEFLDMTGPDVREGVAAVREKRPPNFT